MSAESGSGGGLTEYIKHHLHHLQWQFGDSKFETINLDSVFFLLLASAVFLFIFLRVARRATPGVPGKLQCAIEMVVTGVSKRSMSYIFTASDVSMVPVSCHCHDVPGAGFQMPVVPVGGGGGALASVVDVLVVVGVGVGPGAVASELATRTS